MGSLKCPTSGPLWCTDSNTPSTVTINDEIQTNVAGYATQVLISPLGSRIIGGPNTPACAQLRELSYQHPTVRIQVGTLKLTLSGTSVLGEDKQGAQIVHEEIICNHDLVHDNTLIVGIINSGHAWRYSTEKHELVVHKEQGTSMINTWLDVILVNVCLLAYVHFLSDRKKNTEHYITILPEILGSVAAIVGIYRQQGEGGVYDRIVDYDHASLACQILTACAMLVLVAHAAALLLEYDSAKTSKNWDQWMRIRAARNFSHEYSLLASVYLQVATGVADPYQNYM